MRTCRQHVNPLSGHFLVPSADPILLPPRDECDGVEVELGCADGDFSFAMARAYPRKFIVGLDIRRPMIERNRSIAEAEAIDNAKFGYVNLCVDLDRVFPSNSVDRFHLLFPDPWFKRSHAKRRVVGPELFDVAIEQLVPGGYIEVASDIYEIGIEAMAELEKPRYAERGLTNALGPWSFCRDIDPLAISRREKTTHARQQRVWRVRFKYDPT